tara:strand:+ start:411 stop:734 length:324 start_codon:yes stop_codon:yes gene_type:complete
MSSNPDHIENLHNLKSLGFDVEEQLEDTFESWGYDEQVYLMNGIIPRIRNIVEQNKALMVAITEISNMCIGEIAMDYKLDAACIGDLIYDAIGMTNSELNKALEQSK